MQAHRFSPSGSRPSVARPTCWPCSVPARRLSKSETRSAAPSRRTEIRARRRRGRSLGGCVLASVLLLAAGGLAFGAEQPPPAPSAAAKLPFRIVEKSLPERPLAAQATADGSLPLKAPKKSSGESAGPFHRPAAGGAVTTVITSLAVVLGLFFLSVLIAKKANSRGGCAKLPGEVVQTLGRAPLSGRQEMHLVRVGNKLLLLSVTSTGAETLTEITDPEEIDRLAGICRQNHPDSITASFREILWQCGQTRGT